LPALASDDVPQPRNRPKIEPADHEDELQSVEDLPARLERVKKGGAF